jgi:GTPase SAR1 family protein
MSEKGILFSGLPGSGKTTYLAALWYYIFNNRADIGYTCDSLEDTELTYLNSISRSWASCSKVIRTNQNKIEMVDLKMIHTASKKSIALRIPDLSGETFNSLFRDREWLEEFDNLIENVKGLVLFLNPSDQKNKPKLIDQEKEKYRIFDADLVNNNPDSAWTDKLVPSQVKLVDFLQMVDFHKPNSIKKIAVIISSYDLVKSGKEPEKWCKEELPLLHQYLQANMEIFTAKYFGVSSQGGTYENDKIKEKLLAVEDPLERISVTDGITISNNILSPLLWITDEDKN